jgi:hypothetical protein
MALTTTAEDRARLTIADRAQGVDEARRLLCALGLIQCREAVRVGDELIFSVDTAVFRHVTLGRVVEVADDHVTVIAYGNRRPAVLYEHIVEIVRPS